MLTQSSLVQAAAPIKKATVTVNYSLTKNFICLSDTTRYQRQDEKKDRRKETSDNKEKPNNKQEPSKPDIPEVPKARKQSRPPVVAKPNIKVKPIKVIRPKIKRP